MKTSLSTLNSGTRSSTYTIPDLQGIVYKRTTGFYTVHANGRSLECTLSIGLRKALGATPEELQSRRHAGRQVGRGMVASEDDRQRGDPVAVGDLVYVVEMQDGSGQITAILPRRNRLSRSSPVPMPSARPYEQVIVANLDQVVPVFAAASPDPKWNMLDRYLVSAEAADIPALICITKLDLVRVEDGSLDEGIREVVEEYRRIGYQVILASAVTGEGLDEMKVALEGRISVLLGKSGVGKSTLLNALQPGLGLRVNAVSQATGKGKHTTTHLEMFPLEFAGAGAVVDTPGVREFGLWNVNDEDLAHFYPEMRPYIGSCKFGLDCRHAEEPGCAIRKAVMAGHISPRRYQSFERLRAEL